MLKMRCFPVHHSIAAPCHYAASHAPATAQWPAGQCINLHKKERLALYSFKFKIENYLKTSRYKRW